MRLFIVVLFKSRRLEMVFSLWIGDRLDYLWNREFCSYKREWGIEIESFLGFVVKWGEKLSCRVGCLLFYFVCKKEGGMWIYIYICLFFWKEL